MSDSNDLRRAAIDALFDEHGLPILETECDFCRGRGGISLAGRGKWQGMLLWHVRWSWICSNGVWRARAGANPPQCHHSSFSFSGWPMIHACTKFTRSTEQLRQASDSSAHDFPVSGNRSFSAVS